MGMRMSNKVLAVAAPERRKRRADAVERDSRSSACFCMAQKSVNTPTRVVRSSWLWIIGSCLLAPQLSFIFNYLLKFLIIFIFIFNYLFIYIPNVAPSPRI